jgi:predicted dehydrogenase
MAAATGSKVVRVGVIGVGGMGRVHLDAYATLPDVQVVALADRDPDRLTGSTGGGFDLGSSSVRRYDDGEALVADPEVDAVSICVPTPGHLPVGLAALSAGKHALIEKPPARTFAEATRLADEADAAWDRANVIGMAAMCMRFWPGWQWLSEAVADGRFGRLRAASFRRVSSFPGGSFYGDGRASGGALLDLHVHDLDFVRHAMAGGAKAEAIGVDARGYIVNSGEIDHVLTRFDLPSGLPNVADDALVFAEGGWTMGPGFPFVMRFTATFERATADFDFSRDAGPLRLYAEGGETSPNVPAGMGYEPQLAYFIDCVRHERRASRATLRDAAESVKLAEKARLLATGGDSV